jgi:hypothetical protein
MHYVEYDSNSSSDESNGVYAAEFIWPSKANSYCCDSLNPLHKNQQGLVKFTFNIAKCDKIFDELHKVGCIKMSHITPPLDELKRRAYYRCHNSYSHATNNYNIFHGQVQSVISERRLSTK